MIPAQVVTGAAGFIGSHTSEFLLARGETVVGIDEINDYYDVSVKQKNIQLLEEKGGDRFVFYKGDICDKALLEEIWDDRIFIEPPPKWIPPP